MNGAAAVDVFRSVFEAYPDGVLLVDSQGRVLLANSAASTLLGHSREALQHLSVDDLVPDHVAPRHAALRHSYAQAPKSRPMGTDLELNAKRADGSLVMVEIALSPLNSFGHEFVVVSLRGIGAYPRVKRALQRARYNEFVVRLGRLAVDTLDPDELLQRVPATVQEAMEAGAVGVTLLSHDQRELHVVSYIGPDAEDALRHVYSNLPATIFGEVIAQRTPLVVTEFEHERRFAVPTSLARRGAKSMVLVPLVDRGKAVGTLGAWSPQPRRFGEDEVAFLQSVASLLSTSLQRAQADAQLRHSQRLETVGQLTGGVAHDFNNLLTVILGNLQMLADQPECQSHGLSHQLVAAAIRAGQRGADLTGKLLAFSRRQSLAPEPVDPVAMVHSLADMLRRTLGERIKIVVLTPAQNPHCLADAVQLESALLNVAVNARDAMPDGGTLQLRCGVGAPPEVEGPQTRPAELGELTPACSAQQWVWFSVQDDGYGMPREVLDRAFEPFFTTKAAGRGTGLGLSTVYGFVKQSHGHIAIDSTPGAGTTVTLYLPEIEAGVAAQGEAACDAPTQLPPGLRVLLVEDDDGVRGVAQSFLAALGCEVLACPNAAAALAALAKAPPVDLLFSDIRLGAGIDGIELASQVAATHPDIAVLLSSGFSRHADGDAAAAPLRWPVLKKPYDREALAQAIAARLAGRTG